MVVLRTAAALVALAVAAPAVAHVTVQPAEAPSGAYQVLRFGIGHGCGDKAATTALRVEIPAGVAVARPQPKPGWTLEIVRSGEAVSAVVWRGALPADQFDEFVILTKLPGSGGPLPFPVIQTCEAAEARWVESRAPGQPRPKFPAPVVTLIPAAPEAGHDHH
jgi:hypothetical protein